jgi:hypothetical protein
VATDIAIWPFTLKIVAIRDTLLGFLDLKKALDSDTFLVKMTYVVEIYRKLTKHNSRSTVKHKTQNFQKRRICPHLTFAQNSKMHTKIVDVRTALIGF